MPQSKPSLHCEHFRNAMGQVWMRDSFDGPGLFVTDLGEIVVGEFSDGDLSGWYVYLGETNYAYGTCQKNKLQGYNVIKTNEATVFGNFKDDYLEGLSLIVHQANNKVEVVEYERGKQAIQVDVKPLAGASLSQLIMKHFGVAQLTPRQYLSSKVEVMDRFGLVEKQIGTNLRYFGFIQPNKHIGLIFNDEFLQNCGQFFGMALSGLGRFCQFDGTVFDGVFENGEWTEDGIEFKKSKDTNVTKEIVAFRKQYHLKQMDFNNCHFVVRQYLNIFNICLKPPEKFSSVQDLLKTRDRRTTSFRESSPLKQKLRLYEKEVSKYLNSQEPMIRPYTRSIHEFPQPQPQSQPQSQPQMVPSTPQSPKYIQPEDTNLEGEDVYELVKKMELQESQKRVELEEMGRTRTRTML